MRFDLFSSGRLYAALKEAGYPDLPAPRTLRDWISNDSAPEGARRAVASLLGTTEEAPPPDWAEGLASRVADSVVERVSELLGAPESPLSLLPELYDTLVGELPPDEPPPSGGEASPGVAGTARQPARSRRGKS